MYMIVNIRESVLHTHTHTANSKLVIKAGAVYILDVRAIYMAGKDVMYRRLLWIEILNQHQFQL